MRLNLCIASLFVCVLGFGVRRAQAQNVTLVSRMGAKCLDAEGGRSVRGTRLIGYPCNGQANEQFHFNTNGTVTQRGMCVDVTGGVGRDGDQIELWDCNGGANQKWRMVNGQLVGMHGKCIDLKGGSGWWFGNQPAILWPCNGQDNQHWYRGVVVAQSRVRGSVPVKAGALQKLNPVNASAASVISAGGGNVVPVGGGNVISAGGGNVIAAGGGNVIPAGAGNLIVVTRD
ncbi:MAG TPA: ricin-type beta-trefoil lectin domain protein [Candidatus Angelobacter sp.]|nr:ricin-type beta-trefoil lectin domain protein [Candidatus Angelobacter sp.]